MATDNCRLGLLHFEAYLYLLVLLSVVRFVADPIEDVEFDELFAAGNEKRQRPTIAAARGTNASTSANERTSVGIGIVCQAGTSAQTKNGAPVSKSFVT